MRDEETITVQASRICLLEEEVAASPLETIKGAATHDVEAITRVNNDIKRKLIAVEERAKRVALANTSETYILVLLWASLAVYLTYIVSLTLMAFFAKKRVYDHHLGFFGNLLNRKNTARPDRAEPSAHPLPVDTRDDAVTPLFAGLVFIKSPHYSQATYATFQWRQHWCALYRDELVIHRDPNPLSPLAQTIPISAIAKVVCDALDASFFTLSMWDGTHTQRYTIRSPHRAAWVAYFQVLLQENNSLVKAPRGSLFAVARRKLACRATSTDAQSCLVWPRKPVERAVFVFFWPLLVLLYYTVPDVRTRSYANLAPLTIAALYIVGFALLGLFCRARLAVLTTCPGYIAGFTFIALSFSVRHVIVDESKGD